MASTLTSHPTVKDGLEESLDPFPPARNNSLPPLESREAQSQFLSSPTAVVESLGLRIPAALSQHIRRRSSLPPSLPPAAETLPMPAATDEVSGIQRVAAVVPPELAQLPPPPKVPADAVALVEAVEPAALETKRARRGGRRKKS